MLQACATQTVLTGPSHSRAAAAGGGYTLSPLSSVFGTFLVLPRVCQSMHFIDPAGALVRGGWQGTTQPSKANAHLGSHPSPTVPTTRFVLLAAPAVWLFVGHPTATPLYAPNEGGAGCRCCRSREYCSSHSVASRSSGGRIVSRPASSLGEDHSLHKINSPAASCSFVGARSPPLFARRAVCLDRRSLAHLSQG
jgi:hypothetical protein